MLHKYRETDINSTYLGVAEGYLMLFVRTTMVSIVFPCCSLAQHVIRCLLWCAGWPSDPRQARNPSIPWALERLRSCATRSVNCRRTAALDQKGLRKLRMVKGSRGPYPVYN